MPRGRKRSHKGGHRHFTSEDDMEAAAEKERKERDWRHMKGIESEEEETPDPEGAERKVKEPVAPMKTGEPGELPSDDSEEEDEEDDDKPKGVAHLIEIENPNRMKPKAKKISELNVSTEQPGGSKAPASSATGAAASAAVEESTGPSRREREEFEKQAAKERYDKMHLAGKTDEARADLARLALIRRQREEAAKKRDQEKKAQDDVKTAAEQRLLDKKSKTGADTTKH